MPQARPTVSHFSGCLVDGDEAAGKRARRLRRKALLISVAIQGLLVLAMLLGPLVATSERPRLRYVHIPPYRGAPQDVPEQKPAGTTQSARPRRGPIIHGPVFQPPTIPERIDLSPDSTAAAPDIGLHPPAGCASCVPGGTEPLGPLRPDRATPLPAPAPTTAARPPRIHRGVDPAQLLHRVDPVYPALLRPLRVAGVVELRAVIATDGTIQELELLSGHPILAHAAIEAVRQWRYRPTLLNGQPVEVETRITVVFELRR